MVASNAREVLQKENELLNKLIETASGFVGGLTGVQADVLNDWGDYFKGWRGVNVALLDLSDAQLGDELDKEMQRLKKFRDALPSDTTATSDTPAVKFHKETLDADFEDAKKLRT